MSKISAFNFFFNKIDLYGLSFPLRYNAHHKFNTLCGKTLSILTILCTTIVVILFLIQNFSRNNMTIIHNSEQLYEKKILNFSRLPFLIGFINYGGRPVMIDPKYVSITLDKNDHYPEINKEGIMLLRRESTPIQLEYCDLNKHFNNDSDVIQMIKNFEYQNYLCVVPGQNLSIAGRFGDSIHGYDMLEIHLIKCDNKTNNNNCVSTDELNRFYTNSYMSILYLNEALEHHDKFNPIRKSFRSEVFTVVSNSVKRYYYYFAPAEYISNNGYFFNVFQKYEFFEYEKTQIDFVDEEDQSFYSNETLIEVCFSSVDKFVKVERTYPKIQDSLGNIGGWIRIILIICQLISDYFSEKIFLIDIINKISNLTEKENLYSNETKNDDRNYKNNFNKNIHNNFNYNDINNNKNNDNEKIKNNNFMAESNSRNKIFLSRNSNKGFNIKEFHFNSKIENLNKNQITNEDLIKFSSKRRKIQISLLDYILPFWVMKKSDKFSFILFYKNFIYKDISLEVLIPIIERLYKLNIFGESSNNFFSKVSKTFIDQTTSKNLHPIHKT